MEIENKHDKHRQNRNNTSHRIFKIVILFIVAVFFYLIYSFVKIQFFTPHKNKGFNFEFNSEKYKQLDIRDQHFQYLPNKNKGQLEECNLRDFYYEHVSNYKPCFISKKTNSELEMYFKKVQEVLQENLNLNIKETQPEKLELAANYVQKNLKGLFNKMGLMEFAKILNFSQLFLMQGIEKKNEKENKTISSKPVLNNKDYLFLQLEGETQFILCPITQINRLNVYRENEETNNISKFNPIYSGRDFLQLYNKIEEDKSNLIIMSIKLEKGDLLYVPAYYFISNNLSKEKEELLKFEFESNSRILNTMFKVLFDDNFDLNKELENNFMS